MTQTSRLEAIRARLDTPFEQIRLADLFSMHFMLAEIDRLAERVKQLEKLLRAAAECGEAIWRDDMEGPNGLFFPIPDPILAALAALPAHQEEGK